LYLDYQGIRFPTCSNSESVSKIAGTVLIGLAVVKLLAKISMFNKNYKIVISV